MLVVTLEFSFTDPGGGQKQSFNHAPTLKSKLKKVGVKAKINPPSQVPSPPVINPPKEVIVIPTPTGEPNPKVKNVISKPVTIPKPNKLPNNPGTSIHIIYCFPVIIRCIIEKRRGIFWAYHRWLIFT